jgi:hypothetical protein
MPEAEPGTALNIALGQVDAERRDQPHARARHAHVAHHFRYARALLNLH